MIFYNFFFTVILIVNPPSADNGDEMEIDLDVLTQQQQQEQDEQQSANQIQNNEREKQRVLVNYLKVFLDRYYWCYSKTFKSMYNLKYDTKHYFCFLKCPTFGSELLSTFV